MEINCVANELEKLNNQSVSKVVPVTSIEVQGRKLDAQKQAEIRRRKNVYEIFRKFDSDGSNSIDR